MQQPLYSVVKKPAGVVQFSQQFYGNENFQLSRGVKYICSTMDSPVGREVSVKTIRSIRDPDASEGDNRETAAPLEHISVIVEHKTAHGTE